MKKVLLVVAALVMIVVVTFVIKSPPDWEARVDAAFAGEPCPEPADRDYPAGSYTGPLYDTHIHVPSIPDGPLSGNIAKYVMGGRPTLGVNVTMDEMACTFEAEGTDKVFAFFPVWKDSAEPMVEVVERSMASFPGQFVPFIMPPDHDDSPDGSPTVDATTLETLLDISSNLFAGYGEIGLYERSGGAKELPPDDPRLLEIYPLIQAQKLLVYVHLGRGHQDNFERVADLYPDISFIFHGDQLIAYGEEGRQDLSVIDTILSNHPNVYYGVDELYGDDFLLRPEVSKEQFFAHFEDYEPLLEEDLATWSAFIERHSTQVLWGTDRGWSSAWSLDQETGFLLTDYARAFIGRLPTSIQENYAYKNAEHLLAE